MRIWTDKVKCLINTDVTAVIQASFLLPFLFLLSFTTLPSSSPSCLTVFFLLSGKLQPDPETPPLSPCPGQSTSPGTQQAARWASPAVWTRGLVRKEECVECKWTHTQSVKTHTYTITQQTETHKQSAERDRLMRKRNDTASLVCHRSPLIRRPPSAHSPCSSPGRMEGWTFTDRIQVRRICLPQVGEWRE